MGTTTKRVGKDGKVSVQAKVRKHGVSHTGTFASQKLADAWITEMESKLNKGEATNFHDMRKITLGTIFTEYMKVPKLSSKKVANLARLKIEIGAIKLGQFDSSVLRKYLEFKLSQPIPEQKKKKKEHPLFKGGKVLAKVIDEDGEEREELVVRTYSPATIRHYYYDLRNALEWHAGENTYHFNSTPFEFNQPPGAWDNPRDRRIEGDELQRLIDACDRMYKYKQDWKDLINFQVLSAMRIGETLLMRWKDLMIDENEPHGSFVFVPKEHQKTKNSKKADDRSVSMRRELYNLVVNNLMPRRGKPDERVFPYWEHSGIVGHAFRRITKNAKVEDFNVHDFRHEAISWMFENTSLTDIEIAKITGHTEMNTLMRYAKLRPKKTGAKLWAGLQALPA